MGASIAKLQPDDLIAFRKLPEMRNSDDIEIPERAENRVPTDRKYIIVLVVMVVLLMPFLIYTLVYSDIDRISGYDACGNVCGKKNDKYAQWSCTGEDYTDKKFLELDETGHSTDCVSSCNSNYQEVFGICVPGKSRVRVSGSTSADVDMGLYMKRIGNYLDSVAWRITLACLFSLVISVAMLYLFRTATAAMVWSILAGVVVFKIILVGALWYGHSRAEANVKPLLLFLAVFFTILLLILVFVMIFLYKKIALVIALLKEAMKAVFAMPQLMFIPILTFIISLIVAAVWITTQLYLATAGVLGEVSRGHLEYMPNIVMKFSMIYNFWMAFWGSQIIIGIQYMVIAGAVAKWYFAKNKNYLESPLLTSASIAFKYHLGSVVFGSLVITIVAIVRSLLSSLTKNKAAKAIFDCCLQPIEDFIKFLSKNAYILTAMHGKPFYKSGKRAAQIIFQNVLSIATINYVGDFILFMAHLLVMLLSLLFTYLIMPGEHSDFEWAAYLLIGFVSLIVASICFAIFETVIDTIFLCFCEDSLLNDGMARPYAMSRDLMEFVENSKTVFVNKKK